MSRLDTLWDEFRDPGPEWRGKPFWSWNGRLEREELLRQIDVMKAMGLGGFFMHSRTGLITEYLGDEWFDLTNACADYGEQLGMEAWLYDEDRWPSGTAGGMVTEDPEFRARFLHMRQVPPEEFEWPGDALAVFVAAVDGVVVREYERVFPDTDPQRYGGRALLVFDVREAPRSSFYNGNTDVDRLKREATDAFIASTHRKYLELCGDRFGRSIRGIFTDEPHRQHLMCGFGSGSAHGHSMVPWTEAVPAEFEGRFAYDLLDRLPEVFLIPASSPVSQVKWHFVEILEQLFLGNFARPLYDWCEAHRLLLTGHALHEDNLTSQVAMLGSIARFYEFMHYPGVDVLSEGNRCYWIVKQLSSAARQLGQKWLLSELYGCTGWQMSFESHKAVGDWQALFGINLRCHHLSWYTMQGEAKRDYPASIFHQSAWWRDYHHVETHFARLGRVLSEGGPCCDVLVLSPVESLWCQVHVGWADGLSPASPPIRELEHAYAELFFWLAGGHIDFDYADEEMLSRLGSVERDEDGAPVLRVGQAEYRAVVLGRMTTVRGTSLALLERFADAGGAVIFVGEPPAHVDALPSARAEALAAHATRLPWDGAVLRRCLGPLQREPVEVVDPETDAPIESIFCQLRADGEYRYLVALNVDPARGVPAALIRIRGDGPVAEWSCLRGTTWAVDARRRDGWLGWATDFPPSGERVFVIGPDAPRNLERRPELREVSRITLSGPFEYTLGEPNVCVLDFAKWTVDGGPWEPRAEVLKVDQRVRERFGLPPRSGEMVQPWFRAKFLPPPERKGTVTLAFDFTVDAVPAEPVHLCVERPSDFVIAVNGSLVRPETEDGWWVDIAFRRFPIPPELLRAGANEITLETQFDEGIEFEALYLTGAFGVRLDGPRAALCELPGTLRPADLVAQGLPFYTGGVAYRVPVPPAAAGRGVGVELPAFEGACAKACGPDGSCELIAWQPYRADLTLPPDADAVEVEVVLTRRNTFGPLHQVPLRAAGYGPGNFVTEGAGFSESYMLYPSGLLEPPVIVLTEPDSA